MDSIELAADLVKIQMGCPIPSQVFQSIYKKTLSADTIAHIAHCPNCIVEFGFGFVSAADIDLNDN